MQHNGRQVLGTSYPSPDSYLSKLYSNHVHINKTVKISKRETLHALILDTHMKNLALFPQVESETKNVTFQIYKNE